MVRENSAVASNIPIARLKRRIAGAETKMLNSSTTFVNSRLSKLDSDASREIR